MDDPAALPHARRRLADVRAKLRDLETRLKAGEGVGDERDYYVLIVAMWEDYVKRLEMKIRSST